MKIILVAPNRSTHTINFVNSLSAGGVEIVLFNLFNLKKGDYFSEAKVPSFLEDYSSEPKFLVIELLLMIYFFGL